MAAARASETESGFAAGLALTIFFTLAACLSIALVQPPRAAPFDAPPNEFSSQRALRHLRAVAQAPHPTGSAEHVRVRTYIEGELASLGLKVEVQRATVVSEGRTRERPSQAANVHNVVARLRGTESGDALMLAAHYDSAPNAPGATDDGAGVAALLETLRALKSGPPLKNDLILLFTDAEELGLMGARAFADEHAWMRDVRLVLNFEGRGRGGPSFMFETSAGNDSLIGEFARAAPHPVANSLMYSLYESLPNDTDMTVFKRAGAAGLNFAYTDGLTHYHTALDTPDETDERSLQHHGTYALALARHFGNLNLKPVATRPPHDAVYFNALGSIFIHYPETWVAPITAVVTLAFAALVYAGRRRGLLNAGGIAYGFASLLAGVCASIALGVGARWLVAWAYPGYKFLPWGTPYNSRLIELGLVAITAAVCAALFLAARRRAGAESLRAGALLCWVVLLVVSTVLLPAASFLFAWPLLFTLGGLAYALVDRNGRRGTWKWAFVSAISGAPAVVLVAPIVYMLFVLLGLGMSAPALALVALLTCLLAADMRLSATRRAWWLPAAACVLGLGLVGAGFATASFDARRRKVDHVFYELDADAGRARWLSSDAAPDEWTSQFFTSDAKRDTSVSVFPWERATFLTDEAPPVDQPPPVVEVLEDATVGPARGVRLRISSPRGAPLLMVYTDAETNVLSAYVGGKRLVGDNAAGEGEAKNYLRFFYSAPPAEGVELRLEVSATRPLKLTVVDAAFGLPPIVDFKPRPPDIMPRPSRMSDVTLVKKSFTLDARSR